MILMSMKTENPLEIKEFLKWCSLLDNIISSHASSTSLSTAPYFEPVYYTNSLIKNQGLSLRFARSITAPIFSMIRS